MPNNDIIDLTDSPKRGKKAASASASTSRKRARPEDNTEPCTACDATGRVAKKAKKAKKEDAPSRWPWIDRCRPDLQFKNTSVQFYNCGGLVFKATGKTMQDRLDKVERFLEECDGDETCHPSYGSY